MVAFRVLLVLMFLVIAAYTAFVIADHGIGLFPVFFGDIARMGWPGQFNVDFTCFLTLSAVWVAWRHGFTAPGLALAVLAFLGGALFLSVYLLVLSFVEGGGIRAVMLGRNEGS
ncbi:MAG: hypothetical protein P8Y69_08665 [Gammaproteobacteria bacterium]|jgi:hypothetical protein